MGRVKNYVPRSRNGCVTCKRRKVKCDETHPKCTRCVRLKISCLYETRLKWEEEARERGVTFGRSFKARRRKQLAAADSDEEFDMDQFQDATAKRVDNLFINFNYEDFLKFYDFEIPESVSRDLSDALAVSETGPSKPEPIIPFDSNFMTRLLNAAPDSGYSMDQSPLLTIDDIFLNSLSPGAVEDSSMRFDPLSPIQPFSLNNNESSFNLTHFERHLLVYFVQSIGPYCVCYPRLKRTYSVESLAHAAEQQIAPELNPYLYLIVPLALKSQLVMKALVASTAKQLVLLGGKDYEETAKRYSYEVLNELPDAIRQKQANKADNWDDVLATMVMLCFTEILVRCDSSWLVHLNGAKQFLKDSWIQNNLSPVGKFFVRYFISHEIMAETAWMHGTEQEVMLHIQDDPQIEALKNDPDSKIDLVLGCSPCLISLIHKISVLGKCLEDLELESGDDRARLETEILSQAEFTETSLLQLEQRIPQLEEPDQDSEGYIRTISEIKRYAALIYLFARIHLEFQFSHQQPMKLEKVKLYIEKIMGLYGSLPGNYVSLLWPVFIVGIFATTEEQRWFVLDSMTEMEKHRELSSVKSAKWVVTSVWREQDLRGSPARWKDLMVDKASTISLA